MSSPIYSLRARAPFALTTALLLALLAIASLQHARAADVTWSSAGTSTAGGDGNWTGGSTWWNGSSAVTWTAGDNATFSAAGNTTVNTSVTIGNFTFSSSTADISVLGGAGDITLNSGITATNSANTAARIFTISESIALGTNQTWAVNAGGATGTANLTVSGIVSGTNLGITKEGNGTLTLTAANTYTGGTTVNAGTLQIGNRTNTTASVTGTTTLSGGNLTYDYNSSNFGVNGAITLTAEATITKLNGTYQYNFGSGTLNGGGQTLNIYVDTTGGTMPLYFNQTAGTSLGQVNILNGAVGQAASNLPLRNATVNVSSGAQFRTFGTVTINNNITLNGGAGPDNNGALYNEGFGAATYSGTITLASDTVSSIGTAGGAITISGQVTGSGSLTKIAANTLTLSNSTTNYTGTTTVSAGTLAIGNNMTIGAITGSGNLSLGTGFTLTTNASSDSTYTGVIGGSGALAKSGNSTLTLSGSNTYSGGTTLAAGKLNINNASALGNRTLTITSGTLDSTVSGVTLNNNAQNWNGDFSFAGTNDLNLGTGAVSMNASRTITTSNGNLAVGGVISGSGFGITKNGSGTLTLSGNNTYTGTTRINAGTISIGHINALGSGGNITFSGGGVEYGSSTPDISSRIKNSGSAILVDTNSNNVTFSSVVGTTNTGGLTKNGSGTLTLIAANTYTGGTTVNAGTLQIGNRTNSTASVTGTTTLSGGNLTYDYNNFNYGVNGAITLTAEATITKMNGVYQYNFGSGTLNGGGQTLNIYVDTTGGTKPLYFNQTAGTSLGHVNILNGAVGQASGTGLPLRNATVNVSSGAQFRTYGNMTINNNITLNGGAGPDNNGALYHEVGGAGVATYSGTITLASDTVSSIGTAGGAITISGQVTGSGSLTKIAANTLTLSNSTTNYTGTTTVSAGTLAIGNNMTIGAITGSGNLSLGTGLTLTTNASSDSTYTGVIAGSGALAKSANSTLTLSGSNTYSGGTTLNSGTLVIGNTAAAGTGTITQTDGTSLLKLDTTGTIANAMSIYNVSANKTVTLSGGITVNNAVFDVATGETLTISGDIDGTGGVTKNGTGTLVLSGNNTYSAPTVVNAGILEAASAGALGSNNTVQVNGGTLLVSTDDVLQGQEITLNGTSATVATISFNSNYNGTIQKLTLSADSIIDLGPANTVALAFADLAMGLYNLSIYNWSGTTKWGTTYGNGTDTIFFGNQNTPDYTLSNVRFYSGAVGSDSFVGSGFEVMPETTWEGGFTGHYIIPVPEPETYATGLLLLLGGAWWMWCKRKAETGERNAI